MALRAVPDHPKFAHLKSLLKMTKGATLGYLECVWHFAGRFTPQGNIGKYTDTAIEAWVEWDGEPGALIDALVESRWIDRDDAARLLVHDWSTHADKATKQALTRANLGFCVPTVHTPGAHNTVLRTLPVPVPVPESVPVPEAGTVRTAVDSFRKMTKPNGEWPGTDRFNRAWERHRKNRGKTETYETVARSLIGMDLDWDEVERKHIGFCAEWDKSDWHMCSMTFLEWVQNKMPAAVVSKPPGATEISRPPNPAHQVWSDPLAGMK